MPQFLFRARSRDGVDLHERIEATNLGQARFILEVRGYREIEFLTDEHIGDIQRAADAGGGAPAADPEFWTAEDEVAAARRKGSAAQLWWAFKQHSIIIVPLLIWNAYSLRGGPPFGWLDWLGFLLTPVYAAYFVTLSLPMVIFQTLLEASVWCDWPKVHRCVRWARRLRRLRMTGIPESELDFRDAYALGAEGEVETAVKSLEKYRGHPEMAEYVYLSRLASVYEYAGRYREMVALLEQSAAKGPGGVSEWIDVAMARVRYLGDVAGAKAALENVGDKEIPAFAGSVLMACLGIIACEERDFAHARELLEGALARFAAAAGNPLMQVLVADAKAYLVLALAGLGEKALARRHFAEIRSLLAVRNDGTLLERCRLAAAD